MNLKQIWTPKRIVFYALSIPCLLLTAWLTSWSCVATHFNGSTPEDATLASKPEQLGFDEQNCWDVGFDNLRYYRKGNKWLEQPYPGYEHQSANQPITVTQAITSSFSSGATLPPDGALGIAR